MGKTRKIDPAVAHHRARRAVAIRYGDTTTADEALADLRAAQAETWVEDVVRTAPALSKEQTERLAALLFGSEVG
jgi:hypothetical protein